MPQSARQPDDPAPHRTSRRNTGWLVFLLVWGLIGALGAPSAIAQKGAKKSAGSKAGAKKKKKKKKKPSTTSAKKKKRKTTDFLVDLKRLPSMNINKPLFDKKDDYEKLEKSLIKRKYTTVLRSGVLGPANSKVIADWAKWRIWGMTLPENRDDLFKLRQKVLYQISYSGRNGNPGAVNTFRTAVIKQVVARCEDVLNNNYYVRLHAIMILGHLNLNEDYDVKTRKLPVAYGPAYKPLLEKVLLVPDKDQPQSLKIAAAKGLYRIALLAPRNKDRSRKLAVGLIKEFNRKKTHPWYQCRLAEAMAAIDLKANPEGEAIIVQALAKAVVNLDKSRTYPVRSQAAMSLGRACLARDVNIDLVMHELVNLGVEMSEQYNADVAARKRLPSHWAGSFLRLYFAFHPVDQLEREFLYKNRLDVKDRYAGFLEKRLPAPQKAQVKAAYEQIKPIVSHVLKQSDKVVKAPVPAGTIANMKAWMASHTPKTFQVQPGSSLPALRATKTAQGKPKVGSKTIDGSSKAVNSVLGP